MEINYILGFELRSTIALQDLREKYKKKLNHLKKTLLSILILPIETVNIHKQILKSTINLCYSSLASIDCQIVPTELNSI